MTELDLARAQMAMLFAFHILFAVAGIGMPVLMVIAERAHLRTGHPVYADLARRWAKGMSVLFAMGAVTGTVLSFELGLLWPRFMAFAGGVIGLPFALEGFAFFTEAIFLGIYVYGWDRVSPRLHLASGVLVAIGGILSGIFVVTANAWMNSPAGFTLVDGRPVDVSPLAAMLNPASVTETIHMTLAAFAASGFAVAGIHAYHLLRDRENLFHRKALEIALAVGCAAAVLQPISGDMNARFVARDQPVKLAALEGQFETERGAPLRIGGIPDVASRTTRYAIEVPKGLSLLAYHDPDARVRGLAAFPRDEWPDPVPVHLAFQAMVAGGIAMALLSIAAAWLFWKKREGSLRPPVPDGRRPLRTGRTPLRGGGVGSHRNGPAALGDPRRHEDGGGGDPRRRPSPPLRILLASLPGPRGGHSLAAAARSRREPLLPRRRRCGGSLRP